MDNGEKIIKELKEISRRILDGEYEDLEEEKKKYLQLKNQALDLGIKFLDGLDFDNIIS